MDEPKKEGVKQSTESPAEEIAETIPQDVKLEQSVEVKEETPTSSAPPKGYVPLNALQEEREHIKLLEEELKKFKESSISSEKTAELPDYEYMTESEKWMAKELLQLKENAKWNEDLSRAKKQFPILGDKETEFKDYCYKFPKSVDVEVLAKSFLFDNKPEPIVEEVATPNKGLEKPTGGSRQTPVPEMSLDDVKRLRETQPRLYEKMIMEGKLKKIPEK